MRVSVFYIIMFLSIPLLYASRLNGQGLEDTRVTIEMKGEKLGKLLDKLQQQTQLSFFYTESEVDRYTVSFPKLDRSVAETLDLALKGTDLVYEINEKAIVLRIRKKVKREKKDNWEELTLKTGTLNKNESSGKSMTVTGKVTDTDGMVIAGVNILVKGTTKGTSSDANGQYEIDVEVDNILVFSFIGFKAFETEVNGRTVIDVMMEEDVAALQEVTVNAGYYTVTDKTKTGNIAKVTAKDIERQPVTSPLMALQGRVPGLDITAYNGAPGGAVKVQLRGQNSLRSDGSYPLYLIDGVPVDSRPVKATSSALLEYGIDPLSTLDPENIESIEVLKDGDATAIYGSRGANGVILITTKKGNKSGKTNFDLNFYQGIGQIGNRLDLLNTEQYLAMRKEAFENDGATLQFYDYDINGTWDTTRYANWQDVIMGGTTSITNAHATFSGGDANTSFSIGSGFYKEGVVFPGDFGLQQLTGHFSLNHSSPNRKLNITLSAQYGAKRTKLCNDINLINNALTLAPNAPKIYNKDGDLNWQLVSLFGGVLTLNSWTNPMSYLLRTQEVEENNLVVSSVISYEIAPGLLLNSRFGFTDLREEDNSKQPIASLPPTSIYSTTTGSANFGNNKRTSWLVEPYLSYTKNVKKHNFSGVLGTTWQESKTGLIQIYGSGYTSDALLNTILGAAEKSYADDNGQYRYNAVYARLGYDWKQKYLLNLTGRRDGSSRFGPGSRFGNFGAIGVAWVFSEESFISENLGFLSFGKLRGSYGLTGNDQIGDYKYLDTYQISNYKYQGSVSLNPSALFNSELAWEETKKLEAGLELGLLKERISVEANWYRNRSSNQLVQYGLPATTGFSMIQSNLDATVENTGWEFVVSTVNMTKQQLKWTTSFNITLPKNKLVAYDGIEDSPYATTYKVGEPLTIQRLYTWNGVNPQTGEQEIEDTNEDGSISDDDKQFMKPRGRTLYGGLINTLRYGNFELSFLLQYSKSVEYGYLQSFAPGFRMINQSTNVLNRWQQDGEVTDVSKYSQIFSDAYEQVRFSNHNTAEVFFVRLKTLSVTYKVPRNISNKAHLQDVNIFLQGQNLFTITDYDMVLDPETGNSLPPLKVLTLGLHLKF